MRFVDDGGVVRRFARFHIYVVSRLEAVHGRDDESLSEFVALLQPSPAIIKGH